MTQMIPISIRLANGEQRFFPKGMRGKLVSEAQADRIWRQVVPEQYAKTPPLRAVAKKAKHPSVTRRRK